MTKQDLLDKLREHGLIHHAAEADHGNCGNDLCMKANAFADDIFPQIEKNEKALKQIAEITFISAGLQAAEIACKALGQEIKPYSR